MKIYYHDYYMDEGIDANEPREVDLALALELFYELTDEENNFFGITDDNNEKCIQFLYMEQNMWLVDIPIPPDFINYQKKADYEECVSIIRNVFKEKKINPVAGMIRVDTMKTTFDEEIKKEILIKHMNTKDVECKQIDKQSKPNILSDKSASNPTTSDYKHSWILDDDDDIIIS